MVFDAAGLPWAGRAAILLTASPLRTICSSLQRVVGVGYCRSVPSGDTLRRRFVLSPELNPTRPAKIDPKVFWRQKAKRSLLGLS